MSTSSSMAWFVHRQYLFKEEDGARTHGSTNTRDSLCGSLTIPIDLVCRVSKACFPLRRDFSDSFELESARVLVDRTRDVVLLVEVDVDIWDHEGDRWNSS